MGQVLEQLTARLTDKSARLAVIGLGYVGLPVACVLAEAGYDVIGVDIDSTRIAAINRGESPIGGEEPGFAELVTKAAASGRLRATVNYADLADREAVIICVDTPIEADTHRPAYRALRAVLKSLGGVLNDGALVIIESTIAPGTMQNIVIPELEQASGKQVGTSFYVGHCPERVTPGRLLHNLINVSRTVGGMTPEVAEAMLALYRNYVRADLDAADLITAEIVKTAENAYRDVQIAFANEVAQVCEALNADVYTVRELLNKSPGRSMHLPGSGVGGHCIPKDPWLLIANVDTFTPQLIPSARAVNDAMPNHMIDLLERALATQGVELKSARVAVLGVAFKEDSDDERDSPSHTLIDALIARDAFPLPHDPYVKDVERDLDEVLENADAAVIMVGHTAYRSLDLAEIGAKMAHRIVVDGRGVIDREAARAADFTLFGVGVPSLISVTESNP